MALQIIPVSADTGTVPTSQLTPAEILAAIIPGLIGMAGVALVAVLMLL